MATSAAYYACEDMCVFFFLYVQPANTSACPGVTPSFTNRTDLEKADLGARPLRPERLPIFMVARYVRRRDNGLARVCTARLVLKAAAAQRCSCRVLNSALRRLVPFAVRRLSNGAEQQQPARQAHQRQPVR
jgi:hypothetical protein